MQHLNNTKGHMTQPDQLHYVCTTLTLPPDPDTEYDESFPYRPELRTYEMVLAGDSGLAYMQDSTCDDPAYTVVHLASGHFVNPGWSVETKRLAGKWIEWLVQLADWTGPVPQIRQECLSDVFALVSTGMLVDPELEDDPDTFNPVEQVQFASAQDAA
jgi:hypothetical protein